MKAGQEGRGGCLGISISSSIQCPLQPVPVSTYQVPGDMGKHVTWILLRDAHGSVRKRLLVWPHFTDQEAVS